MNLIKAAVCGDLVALTVETDRQTLLAKINPKEALKLAAQLTTAAYATRTADRNKDPYTVRANRQLE